MGAAYSLDCRETKCRLNAFKVLGEYVRLGFSIVESLEFADTMVGNHVEHPRELAPCKIT